jgi:hypothetical protein
MAEINEEFIAEYARVIGNAYYSINQGIGDENTPGSAVFNLNQLSYLAEKKLPAFGIVQTNTSSGFTVSPDENDQKFIKISSGKIAYLNNSISVSSQRLSIVKNFAGSYNSSDVYGMRIGFPISEAQKTVNTIYSSVLKENLTTSQNIVYIENPQRIINLGFPITAYIGTNTYVVFESATTDGLGLIMDPAVNGGYVAQSFDRGTSVNFIYEPKVKAIYGLPVPVASHDPAEFLYYPPLPSDWLHIADVLILNPNDPEIDTFGLNPAILRQAIDYPASTVNPPLFSTTDSQTIMKVAESTKNQLLSNKSRASIGDPVRALEYYTSALQESSGKTFRQFWASRPLKDSTYYNKGINYEGLERFEFGDNFADAYHAITGRDLNRTFAMFRGDLYSSPSVIYGSGPASLSLSSIYDFKGITSSLTNGTYYYGVSAVITTGEVKETPTTVQSVITNPSGPNYVNIIQWAPVTNAQFYHVYRKSTQSGEQIEYRLSSVNSIKGAGPFTNTPVSPNDFVNLSTSGIAFKITPTGATDLHLGGILFKLKATSTSLTNLTDYVSVKLYSNDPSLNKPNVEITEATFDNVTFENILRDKNGELTVDLKKIVLKTNYKMQSIYSYWLVLSLNAVPSTGNIQMHVSNASATGMYATYSGSWNLINNIRPYFELLGFVDNGISGTAVISRGVYLTRKITKEPRRLRVYVPTNSSTSTDPLYGPAVSETTTTKNEILVTITAQNGTNDPIILPTITIPQNTASNTQFLVGTANQLFDRVLDVQVAPGTNVTRQAGTNAISWSKYDVFVVENVP